jgi:RNA polymerase sigma factor (sigma-70 family)
MDDAGLVRAAIGGDRSAFADIYDRYADRVHAFATSVLRDPDEAADVTQDTFLVAARRLDPLRAPSRLRPWLFAIARHESFRRAKKRGRQVVTDEFDDLESTDRSADDVMTSQDAVAIVHAAAAGLTERDRAVLDLSLRHGLEGEQLGAAMGPGAGSSGRCRRP